MSGQRRSASNRPRAFTRLELLVVILIIAVLVAILLPSLKWGSSGSRTFPVRVLVFDAAAGKPIPFAEVAFLRAWPPSKETSMLKFYDGYQTQLDWLRSHREIVVTGVDGTATFEVTFDYDASDQVPEGLISVYNKWVFVRAAGFGGSLTPLRYGSQSPRPLRERGEMVVSVGLLPAE